MDDIDKLYRAGLGALEQLRSRNGQIQAFLAEVLWKPTVSDAVAALESRASDPDETTQRHRRAHEAVKHLAGCHDGLDKHVVQEQGMLPGASDCNRHHPANP